MRAFDIGDFEPHLATRFELAAPGIPPVPLELVEVSDKSSVALKTFSLLFKGGFETVFRHDTHRLRHPVLGELDLFLGPVHTGRTDAVYYQAIFSAPREG